MLGMNAGSRYDKYYNLSHDCKKDPGVLKPYIENYDSKSGEKNPISFALKEAITDDNLKLAFEKGNIYFYRDSPLSGDSNFVKRCLEEGKIYFESMSQQYNNLTYDLLKNPEILGLFIKKFNNKLDYNPICYAREEAMTEENVELAIEKGLKEYRLLNPYLRSVPAVLRAYLKRYDSRSDEENPISFALQGALTGDNIDLGINKGNILFDYEKSEILKNKDFVISWLNREKTVSDDFKIDYSKLSDDLRSDPELLNIFLGKYDSKTNEINPISYALEGAITSDNLVLGMDKGNIVLDYKGPFMNDKDFIIKCLNDGKLHPKYLHGYGWLSPMLRKDSEVLELFLKHYNAELGSCNPISYALEGALTEDNVNLAFEKGNINFRLDSHISNDEEFVIMCLRENKIYPKYISSQYSHLPRLLKKNTEILNLFLTKYKEYYEENFYEKNPIIYAEKEAITDENVELAFQCGMPRYKDLSYDLRDNPTLLEGYINHFERESDEIYPINPISYAYMGAITEKNIQLAIDKGNIIFSKDGSLSHGGVHKDIIVRILKGKCFLYSHKGDFSLLTQYMHLCDFRDDPQILEIFLSLCNDKDEADFIMRMALDGALTEENVELAIEKGVSDYSCIGNGYGLKDIPTVLKVYLKHYDSKSGKKNPISYAKKEAITKDNIRLALDKGGNIRFNKYDGIANSKLFVMMCLERGLSLNYEDISDDLKEDPEIIALANEVLSLGMVCDSIDASNLFEKSYEQYSHRYWQSAIGIMPNGEFDRYDYGYMYEVFDRFSKMNSDDENFFTLNSYLEMYNTEKNKDKNILQQYYIALVCSDLGIVIAFKDYDNCQLFLPNMITQEQYDRLVELLDNEFSNSKFELSYDGKEYFEVREDVFRTKPILKEDIINFMRDKIIINNNPHQTKPIC